MSECKRCCGTCEYGSYDEIDGYICVNSESEYVADYTDYDFTCDEWTEKRKIRKSKDFSTAGGINDGNY